jgi:Na+/H+ antiporter NhaC
VDIVNAGAWAFVPALTAIITVFVLKDVIASLFIGIITGAVIYSINMNAGLLGFLNLLFSVIFDSAKDNIELIVSLLLLGALVSVITISGGHEAYGQWIARKVKTARGVSIATVLLGIFIFIDDYFSCLLVGSVMRPIAGKYKISREKLAFFIDSTAGPVCILAPLSSWSPTITQVVEDSGIKNGLFVFIKSIPYNYYAIFVLIFALYIAFFRKDFSEMRVYENRENRCREEPSLHNTDIEISGKGRIFDLVLPNIVVIVLIIFCIAWLGGYFGQEKTPPFEAYIEADTSLAINFACFGTLLFCFLLYIPRRLFSVRQFFENVAKGMESMFVANVILVLAWSLSSITINFLGAGSFVESLMENTSSSANLSFMPLVIFVLSGAIAFGLGSWGTFMMTIPFIAIITNVTDPSLFPVFLGATLAGSVFGDQASPITDTTTLSSISAQCKQLDHVKTQLPYAMLIFLGSAVAFLFMGFVHNLLIGFAIGFVTIAAAAGILYRREKGHYLKEQRYG